VHSKAKIKASFCSLDLKSLTGIWSFVMEGKDQSSLVQAIHYNSVYDIRISCYGLQFVLSFIFLTFIL
jgi:hypothetical protein